MIAELLSTLVELATPPAVLDLSIVAERIEYGVRVKFGDGSRIDFTDEEVDRIAEAKAKGTK